MSFEWHRDEHPIGRRTFLETGTLAAAGFLVAGKYTGASAQQARTPGPIVQTHAGKIRGLIVGGQVKAFLGVPYGASTAGAARFLPPAKPQGWTGVRDAFEIGHRSPQADSDIVPEFAPLNRHEASGEDCLCLNVWTPATGQGKRPVMVWLHGGGYSAGSAGWVCYDGTELARKHDVVVVGVNHRLNVFGYLYLADIGGERYADAGNPGQRDIVLALQWVRDNIGQFGGDAGNVTIFGQSGGGGKVSTLLGMPSAQGLFHRAIAQSGSNVSGVQRDVATNAAKHFMATLGVKTVDELQRLPAEKLLAAMRGAGRLPLAPVVDGKSLPASPFDPTAPSMSADVPMIIGSTETEVTWNRSTDFNPPNDAQLRERVKRALGSQNDAQADHIVAIYRKGRPKASNLDLALILETDVSGFRTGTDTQALRKAALGRAPVYMYRFAWYSPVGGGRLRAMHCMDIPFVFDHVDACSVIVGNGADRQALADAMSGAWAAFARAGNPNHKGIPLWQPFTSEQRATMVFNKESRLVNDPYRDERLAVAASIGGPRRSVS